MLGVVGQHCCVHLHEALPSWSPSPSTKDIANWFASSWYFLFSSGSGSARSFLCFLGRSKDNPKANSKSILISVSINSTLKLLFLSLELKRFIQCKKHTYNILFGFFLLIWRRKHGQVVRALELHFRGTVFQSHPDC